MAWSLTAVGAMRAITAFVPSNVVGKDFVLKAVTKNIWRLCRENYATKKMRIIKMKRRSGAVPLDWRIDGICE